MAGCLAFFKKVLTLQKSYAIIALMNIEVRKSIKTLTYQQLSACGFFAVKHQFFCT